MSAYLPKILKITHTLASVGIMGALVAILVVEHTFESSLDVLEQAHLRLVVGALANKILLPSLALMILSGMFSMMIGPVFYKAGWVWAKLALGLSMFEGTLLTIQGPAEEAADLARAFTAGELPADQLLAIAPVNTLAATTLLVVSTTAVVLGILRPRFS